MTAVSDLLLAETQAAHNAAKDAAVTAIAAEFPDQAWGIDIGNNVFADEGKRNLFRAEISGAFRQWLGTRGIGEDAYAGGIPALQYNSIDVWSKTVFNRYKANEGWRVKVMGFPALSLAAVGMCGNYQGSQAQNAIGAASDLIRAAALRVIREHPDAVEISEHYPSATKDHWDGSALLPAPRNSVGALDISGYDGSAELRMARNTTVKKELASFFFVRGIDPSTSEPPWSDLHTLARSLVEGRL